MRLLHPQRLLIAVAVALCTGALALPAVAGAQVRHVVRGAGFGHGIGMSQYGALGMARQGYDFRQILGHYYRGTALAPAPDRAIRVLLQDGRGEIAFSGATAAAGRRLDPDSTYRARRAGAGVALLSSSGRRLASSGAPLVVASAAGPVRLHGTAINGVGGGLYRGALELRPSGGGLMAVNALSLDEYVQGVVPGEVPASWPAEALRAQAVAARSYALATNRGGAAFDQYPDTRSQVYRGAGSEQASTNRAVQDTAGQVLSYQGRIAVTYFFSTSGGQTEHIENVWPGAKPTAYLRSVADPFDKGSPKHRWRMSFTTAEMQRKLSGLVKGSFRGIRVLRRGASPRVMLAEIRGSRGTTRVAGTTLRARLGLWDTWAYFSRTRNGKKVREKAPPAAPAPGAPASGGARAATAPSSTFAFEAGRVFETLAEPSAGPR